MQFKITEKIKNLEIDDIKENLLHYSYDSKTLKALVKKNTSKDEVSYITAYIQISHHSLTNQSLFEANPIL